jgi:Uma2 family endonuclease
MMAHALFTAIGREVRMHMALDTRAWTRADLDRLPDDGNKYEVLDGELLVTPAPSAPHQEIIAWLNARLTLFVVAHGIGRVHQARSVMVDGPVRQVEPDLMVLPPGRIETWDAAPVPMLVVEVLSKATRRRDLEQKRRFYMERGVGEYWVVDRAARSVTFISRDGSGTTTTLLTWRPTGTPEALEIDVAVMFREALG